MKKIITIVILCMAFAGAFAQQNPRNGYVFPTKGTMRALVVYYSFSSVPNAPSQLPADADSLFNHEMPGNLSELKGITKHFHNASMGEFILLGDYLDEVVMLADDPAVHSIYRPYDYLYAVDALPGNGVIDSVTGNTDLITHNGYSVNNGDFDFWTLFGSSMTYRALPKEPIPDTRLDILILIDISELAEESGGHISYVEGSVKNMIKTSAVICAQNTKITLQHELAHALLGDNLFHAGGPNRGGQRAVMQGMGGYSLLCGSNAYNLISANAWDRWRLGWWHEDMSADIEIGALNENRQIVDADIDSTSGTVEFTLRDFTLYGDAVRIKLPHTGTEPDNTDAHNQYIWLENHQLIPGTRESEWSVNTPTGIRANRQIGADMFESWEAWHNSYVENHYIYPMCPFGNYDFSYDEGVPAGSAYSALHTSTEMANPLTGYHYLMTHPVNRDGNTYITTKEGFVPSKLFLNGVEHNDGFFLFPGNTPNGSVCDAFRLGDKIALCTNPAANSVMTHSTPASDDYYSSRERWDSKYVYLSGLKIEVIGELLNPDGNGHDMRVRISWDDYNITNDVRWTGTIVQNESVIVKAGNTVVLDQGFSPTKPCSPLSVDGKQVFADPTRFIMNNGSDLVIEDGAKCIVRNGSALHMKPGAEIHIYGSGQLILECSGAILAEYNTTEGLFSSIRLHDELSSVIEYAGSSASYWTYMGGSTTIFGIGKHVVFSDAGDLIINNKTYAGDELESGTTITTTGAVSVEANSNVIMTGNTVQFNGTLQVEPGSTLTIQTDNFDCE